MNKSFRQYLFNNSSYSIYSNNFLNEDNFEILNEVYFGKHPLFKLIERKLMELKEILLKDSGGAKPSLEINTYGNAVFSNKLDEKKLPSDIFKKLQEFKKKQEKDIVNVKEEGVIVKETSNFSFNSFDNIIDDIIKNVKNSMSKEFYDDMSKRTLGTVIRNNNYKMSKKQEYDLRWKNFKGRDNIKDNKDTSKLVSSYYVFNNKENNDKANSIIKDISKLLTRIFKFSEVELSITEIGFFCIPIGMGETYLLYRYSDHNQNNPHVKNWINRSRLKRFKINNNSIYMPKDSQMYILIGRNEILNHPPGEIVALMLHEIGHTFGFKMLPIDSLSEFEQEKFADAFATKFGYGPELASILHKTVFSVNKAIIQKALNYYYKNQSSINKKISDNNMKLTNSIKFRIILGLAMTKSGLSGYHDPHPTTISRITSDILKNLEIELANPRLNKLKKRQLMNDINRMKIYTNTNNDNDTNKFANDMIKNQSKFKLAKKEELTHSKFINPLVIKNMLDYIYDESLS